jgi:hypothetical protein
MELNKLAIIPEYQQLELWIDNLPLRLFYGAWHDLESTAEAFAMMALTTSGGKSITGSGCNDDSNVIFCLTNLFKRVMEDRIHCCRNVILVQQQYFGNVLSSEELHECFQRANELERIVEAEFVSRPALIPSTSESNFNKFDLTLDSILVLAGLGEYVSRFEEEQVALFEHTHTHPFHL